MIGLMGAHRVGKSTLCEGIVRIGSGAVFELPISISKMQKELGFNSSNQSYDWETRKVIQNGLLKKFDEILLSNSITRACISQQQPKFITERTPLDLIGYLLINAPDNPTADDMQWISNYIDKCITLTNSHHEKIYLIQPGIKYVECETSAKEDSMDILNAIYLKTLLDPRLTVDRVIVPQEMTDLTERVLFVMENKNV